MKAVPGTESSDATGRQQQDDLLDECQGSKVARRAKELLKQPTPEAERKQRVRLHPMSKMHDWDIDINNDLTNEKHWFIMANRQNLEDKKKRAEVRAEKRDADLSTLSISYPIWKKKNLKKIG